MTEHPERIGPFLIESILGEGGMGVVYHATRPESGERVALKTVKLPNQGLLESLRREIHALSKVEHPGIVRIVGEGVQDGLPWYAMELLEGQPLDEWRVASHLVRTESPNSSVFANPRERASLANASSGTTIALSEESFQETEAVPENGGFPGETGTLLHVAETQEAAGLKAVGSVEGQETRLSGEEKAEDLFGTQTLRASQAQVLDTFTHIELSGTLEKKAEILGASASSSRSGLESVIERSLPVFETPAEFSFSPVTKEALPSVLTLVHRLCGPLAYLHGEGLVHRDLKPGNILVREDGTPVLVDFGLLFRFAGSKGRESLRIEAQTAGTILYMPPEQIRGEPMDARADLYALGCILFELLTGLPPFVGLTMAPILRGHLQFQAPSLKAIAPHLPEELDVLLQSLLAKEPEKRMGHADAIAATLLELGASPDPSDSPKPRPYLYRPGFSGRKAEQEQLRQTWASLREEGGRFVLLGGESGVGKTRLAVEFGQEAARSGGLVLTGQCLPGGGSLQALHKSLQWLADRCREQGKEEVRRLFGERLWLLADYEPSLATLEGSEQEAKPTPFSGEAARSRLLTALIETFQALAGTARVLLILDDLQWADELSLGFLEMAFRGGHLKETPWMVLGTWRSEEPTPALEKLVKEESIHSLFVERLEERVIAELVGDMLAMNPAPKVFGAFLARHAEGNPLFAAEYLRAAIEEGLLWRDEQARWRVEDPQKRLGLQVDYEERPLPRAIQELVGIRLKELPASARELAQVAALLGREFRFELFQRVAGQKKATFLFGLQELRRRQVLEDSGENNLRFSHDLLREKALEGIRGEQSQLMHARAAESIEQLFPEERSHFLQELGRHWHAAGEVLEAAYCWLDAGEKSARDYAVADALQALDAALEALDSLKEPPQELLLRALDARGHLKEQIGQYPETLADAERLLALSRRALDQLYEGRALRLRAHAQFGLGQWERAEDDYQESLVIFMRSSHPGEMATSSAWYAYLKSNQQQNQQALELCAKAFDFLGDGEGSSFLRQTQGLVFYRSQRFEEACEKLEPLELELKRSGNLLESARCGALVAQSKARLGDFSQAIQALEGSLHTFYRIQATQDYLIACSNLGWAFASHQRWLDARMVYENFWKVIGDRSMNWATAQVLVPDAFVRLHTSEFERVLTLTRTLEQSFQETAHHGLLQQCFLYRGLALYELGRRSESKEYLLKAAQLAKEKSSTRESTTFGFAALFLKKQSYPNIAIKLVSESKEKAEGKHCSFENQLSSWLTIWIQSGANKINSDEVFYFLKTSQQPKADDLAYLDLLHLFFLEINKGTRPIHNSEKLKQLKHASQLATHENSWIFSKYTKLMNGIE